MTHNIWKDGEGCEREADEHKACIGGDEKWNQTTGQMEINEKRQILRKALGSKRKSQGA